MFDPVKEMESMDVQWLQSHGWTIAGNLAYRHILYELNRSGRLSAERIEQILMQYDAADQSGKIKQELQDLMALKRDLNP